MAGSKSAFDLQIMLHVQDKFTQPMRQAAQAAQLAQRYVNELNKSIGALERTGGEIRKLTGDFQKLQKSANLSGLSKELKNVGANAAELDKVKTKYQEVSSLQQKLSSTGTKLAVGGAVVTAGSVAVAHGMWDWLDEAGRYQTMMTNIQEKTMGVGTSTTDATKRMESFSKALMDVAQKVTKYNDIDLASMSQQMVSGQLTLDQTQALLLPAARFAELQERMGKDTREGAIEKAISFSHMFRHYSTEGFDSFLNEYNKYTTAMPEKSAQLAETLKYLAPVAQTMGLSEDDIMTVSALANTVGLGGSHGGTNMADTILRLIPGLVGGMPTKKKTPIAYRAMEDMGFVDSNGKSVFFDAAGKLKPISDIMDIFVKATEKVKNPQKLAQDWKDMLGKQGMLPAMIFGNPETIAQMKMLKDNYNKTADMDPWVEMLNNTPQGKMDLLKSNAMTAQIRIAKILAENLTPVLDKLNKILDVVIKFSDEHPQLMKMATGFVAISTGVGLILGPMATLAGGIMTLVANWKLVKTAATEAAAAEEVASTAGSGLLRLLGLLGVVGGIAYVGNEISNRWRELTKNQMPVRDMNSLTGANINHQAAGMPTDSNSQKALQDYLSNVSSVPNQSFHNFIGHAYGGIFNKPHFGVFGEAGPEAFIPLYNRDRGLQVWAQAGAALGVSDIISSAGIRSRDGGDITININGSDLDAKEIAAEVMRSINRESRTNNMTRPNSPYGNKLVFG